MKVSIVIPVYNEADHLAACLAAIARQNVPAHEVIVVDNNSTDGTARIAASFGFVKLLHEPRQGVAHARNRGFNAASGEIIGRIDADTILPEDWITKLTKLFDDQTVCAVSGSAHYYDFPIDRLADAIDRPLRARLARKLKRTNFLWGANLALRRSAWHKVRRRLCNQNQQHEDFDLAIHLQFQGMRVIYSERLLAGVSSRRIDTNFLAYVRYTLVSPQTYGQHNLRSRFHMYPVLVICWLGYLPGRLIYRSYNPYTGTFSFAQLFGGSNQRVDPTTNIVS